MQSINKEEAMHRFGDDLNLSDVPYLNDDLDVVLAAVQKNGLDIQYASPKLQSNQTVVIHALRQNGRAYRVLTPHIKHALQAIKVAYTSVPEILEFVPDEVWRSSKFLQWVMSLPNAIIPNRHKQGLYAYRYVVEHVEVPQVMTPSEFTQDCICFIKGHSNFLPDDPMQMNDGMKHKTLLIADPCDICILFQEKTLTDMTELFSHPEILQVSPEKLLEQVNVLTKEQSGLEERMKSKGFEQIKTAEIFKKSKGYISTDETTFINRTWMFIDKKIGKPDKPSGFILLSYMYNGEMIKERLFIDDIETGVFSVTKKIIFDILYEKGFRNVILIDGGCNTTHNCSPAMISSLREGRFGGKSKKNKRGRKSKKRLLRNYVYTR
jgi:hypothetical protein